MKKKPKRESIAVELTAALERLDKKAEERAEEREIKRLHVEAEIHERQREKEREHEMQMQGMFLSFMQQMIGSSSNAAAPLFPPSTYYPPTNYHNPDN